MNEEAKKKCAYCGHQTARFPPAAEGSMVAPSCPACGLPMDPPPDEWFNTVVGRKSSAGVETLRILIGEVARLREDESRGRAEILDALASAMTDRDEALEALEALAAAGGSLPPETIVVVVCPKHGVTFDLWTGDDMPDKAPCGRCGKPCGFDAIHTMRDALCFLTGAFTVWGTGNKEFGVLNYPWLPKLTAEDLDDAFANAHPRLPGGRYEGFTARFDAVDWDTNDNGVIDDDDELAVFGIEKASVVLSDEAAETIEANGLVDDPGELRQYLAEYLAEVMAETHAMAYEQGVEAASKWSAEIVELAEDVQSD